jgi:hypothetical protein
MTRQQTIERQARRQYPDECPRCGEWVEYVTDPDGIWAECGCDAGYLT